MEITLTPEFEQLVQEQIESGVYSSPSDVVQASLRVLREQSSLYERRRFEIQQMLDHASAQIESGKYTAYSLPGEMATDLKAKARTLLAKRESAQP